MAIKHTAVSYYGLNYVEHAKKDFEVLNAACFNTNSFRDYFKNI